MRFFNIIYSNMVIIILLHECLKNIYVACVYFATVWILFIYLFCVLIVIIALLEYYAGKLQT